MNFNTIQGKALVLFMGCLFWGIQSNAQTLKGSKYRYKIVSLFSNMAIDVARGSQQPNTNIIQWHDSGSNNQRWYFTDAGNGQFRIHSANSYLVLDVQNQLSGDGAAIVQNYVSTSQSQMFSIDSVGVNAYVIEAHHSNKALTVNNGSRQANAQIVQSDYRGESSQKWKIMLVDSIQESFNLFNPGICTGTGNQYRIHSRSDVHLIWDTNGASKQPGAGVDLWGGQGQTHQRCYLEEVNNQQYLIHMLHSGLVIQSEKGSAANNIGIVQATKNGSTTQQYSFVALGDGYYAILNKASGLALTKKGMDIVQSNFTGDINQHWKLILTEGSCNGVTTGITDIQQYFTKAANSTCHSVRVFYVVPSDAPQKHRQALCAAAALSQQRTWAKYGYTIPFEPIVKINSNHNMDWFMTNGDNAWYSYAQNAELEIKANYPVDYNNERFLIFVEGVCSGAAGGQGSAGIPGCMIDGMANGEPNNYGVVGHELGHHMFGTGHPTACEKIFPQDNMCNNVYPASIIYPGSYTDNHIDGNDVKWIAEKSNCTFGTKICNLPTPLAAYKKGNGPWAEVSSSATIGAQLGQPFSLSMSPHNLSYYRWYGPNGLLMRGDSIGSILVSKSMTVNQLGMYRCVGINDEGCSTHIDITVTSDFTSNVSEIKPKPRIYVYPNPFRDKIDIVLADWQQNGVSYSVLNQLGQMLQNRFIPNVTSNSFELNTGNLPNGIYFILIEDKNGNRALERIVKNQY